MACNASSVAESIGWEGGDDDSFHMYMVSNSAPTDSSPWVQLDFRRELNGSCPEEADAVNAIILGYPGCIVDPEHEQATLRWCDDSGMFHEMVWEYDSASATVAGECGSADSVNRERHVDEVCTECCGDDPADALREGRWYGCHLPDELATSTDFKLVIHNFNGDDECSELISTRAIRTDSCVLDYDRESDEGGAISTMATCNAGADPTYTRYDDMGCTGMGDSSISDGIATGMCTSDPGGDGFDIIVMACNASSVAESIGWEGDDDDTGALTTTSVLTTTSGPTGSSTGSQEVTPAQLVGFSITITNPIETADGDVFFCLQFLFHDYFQLECFSSIQYRHNGPAV